MRGTDTVRGREKGRWCSSRSTAERGRGRGSEGGPAIPGETRTSTERGGGGRGPLVLPDTWCFFGNFCRSFVTVIHRLAVGAYFGS